jgi:BirA family biotin operon repressor/biotin-[acetyl-CoA-carboxylase] ligase
MISSVYEMPHFPARAGTADRGLDREAVARLAELDASRIEIVAATDSTNQDLMDRPAGLDALAPRILIAVRQRAGRGRRGRAWLSEPEDCLTMSVSLHRVREASAPTLTGLPLALGVAVAETLAPEVKGIGLKWPNDLLREGRKCAGMLVEARTVGELDRVVIGLGLNWHLPESLARPLAAAAGGAPPFAAAGGLFDELPPPAVRERIAGRVARALIDAAWRFMQHGFGDTALRWARFDALLGREVVVRGDGEPALLGRADGLDRNGALRVRTADGVQSVSAGEVSVRLTGDARLRSGDA